MFDSHINQAQPLAWAFSCSLCPLLLFSLRSSSVDRGRDCCGDGAQWRAPRALSGARLPLPGKEQGAVCNPGR